MNKFKIFLILLFVLTAGTVFAVEIETVGEAVIVKDDKASAKAMALSRAKWTAVETVSPAKIKIDTIINNAELADEAVKNLLNGTLEQTTSPNCSHHHGEHSHNHDKDHSCGHSCH